MQPMTTKEMEYIVDSMAHEDLQLKQCAMTASFTQNQMLHSICMDMLHQHQQHYHMLMNSLHQHASMSAQQQASYQQNQQQNQQYQSY